VSGATYDKQKKTIRLWFGQKPDKCYDVVKNIMKHFKLDWFSNLDSTIAINDLLTTSILQRCIRGKITNPRQLCKAIIASKVTLRKSGLSPEAFYKYITTNNYYKPAIRNFIYNVASVKQPDLYVDILLSKKGYDILLDDLIKDARTLGKKVDMTWSEKRLASQHIKWTREIMALAILSVKEIDFDYPDLYLPSGLQLIKNNHELFEEGTVMGHCIYNNYANSISRYNYFGLRYNRNGVRATAGINLNSQTETITLHQMYSKYNGEVSSEDKEYVQKWLSKPHVQEYFKALTQRIGVYALDSIEF
jgi:hypothetical protein